MRHIGFLILSMSVLAISSCGVGESQSTSSATGDHVEAKNCEIFVDRVATYSSSHSAHGLTVYLKVLKDRLDSEPAEVGARSKSTSQAIVSGGLQSQPEVQDWSDESFENYFGATDYYKRFFSLGSEFERKSHETVFYVRTTRGTTYWFKRSDGQNYYLNDTLFYATRNVNGLGESIPTQNNEALGYLNPQRCY